MKSRKPRIDKLIAKQKKALEARLLIEEVWEDATYTDLDTGEKKTVRCLVKKYKARDAEPLPSLEDATKDEFDLVETGEKMLTPKLLDIDA